MLLVVVGLMWSSQVAQAQIVHEKPSQVKAANRRALRDAKHTASPYKDSHLGVTAARLKRGQSTQPMPEGSDELEYRRVAPARAKAPGFQPLRRKKKE
ncbi:hypothetical protein Q3A66_00425 [Hymenobacter sp. BT770]|uniref:hypothetical protein n=1 Tax=Hymenobacter sp. BT770 TaxID=2886942 RepID=UPI001D10E6D4|nr:hypothetical protein [Hymenobacter sp. BT770]MCC3151866.1 hypothetical protein [Hymenobacter sp. BT770]MDO3413512.1 hypothetical protein [Hymenobacter sp. BT770]